MPVDKVSVRENAAQYFSLGKWDKALEEYRLLARLDPKDMRIRLKIGEVLGKLGKNKEAIDVYRETASRYAKEGFLLQAIAVNKLILAIDPSQEYVQKELARLYAKKGLIVNESLLKKEATDIKERKREQLPRIPLFSNLTESEFLSVIQKLKPRRYPPDAVIVREGEEGDSLFIITDGEIDVYKKDREGKQVWLNSMGEGDFFGEFGFFAESRRKATVKAKGEVEIQELSRDDLESIVKAHPRVSHVLVEFYKTRVLDSILALSPLFRSLTPQQRDLLLDRFELIIVKKGDVVIREGEIGDCLYIIKSGEVEVSKADEKEGKVVLATLKEGDFFGEVSLITGKPRTATVRALRLTRLMRLGKKDFDDAVAEVPAILRSARWYAFTRQINTFMTIMAKKVAPVFISAGKYVWNTVLITLRIRQAKKALVIEDNPGERKALEDYLTSKGYDVTTAESAEQGVKEASATQPDVVLLDTLLPGAGSLEVMKKLEEDGREKKPPIVLMDKESIKDALSPVPPEEKGPSAPEEELLTDIFLPGSVLENLDSLTADEDVELVLIDEASSRTGNLKDTPFPGLLYSLRKDRFTGTMDIVMGKSDPPSGRSSGTQGEKRIHFLEGSPVFVEYGSLAENLGDLLLRKGDISQDIYLRSVEEMARTGKKQGEILIEMGAITSEGLQKALEEQVMEKLFNCFPLMEGTYRITEGKDHLTHIFLKKVSTEQVILEGIRRAYALERLKEELAPLKSLVLIASADFSERLSAFGRSLKESELRDLLPILTEGRSLDEVIVRSPVELKRTLEIIHAFLASEMLRPAQPREEKGTRPPTIEVQDLSVSWEKWKLL